MNTANKKMKSPAEILAERAAERAACRLAHTPNGSNEFFARVGCPCYTCRDVLDPRGEHDAKSHNETLMFKMCEEANISLPPPSLKLTRQNALCVCCETSHSCEVQCVFRVDPECEGLSPQPARESMPAPAPVPALARTATGCSGTIFNLPPPPPAIREPPRSAGSSIMSPLVGIASPRSVSDASTVEERCAGQEKHLIARLKRLLVTYEQLQAHIDNLNDHSKLKHDEMAAYDAWWTEVDYKICAVQDLLKLLEE